MDNESNYTYITLDGYVGDNKYKYVYFFILFTVYILILCSNSTVVCLIWIHKSLHEPMYIFIAALLFNSVLLSTTVYPKLLNDVLSEKQIISYSACLLQFFMFYSVGSAEFVLLALMSYDRYVSICKPLQYPTIMTKTRVSILLVLTWFVSACHIAVPAILCAESKLCNFTMKGIFCNNAIYELLCVHSRVITIYGVIALLDLAVLPVLFIIYTYAKILMIAYKNCGEVRKKVAETCLPHLLVLISFSCLSVYDISVARVESNLSKTARLLMTLQVILYHPLLNPLIYGLKMKDIYKHLNLLLSQATVPICLKSATILPVPKQRHSEDPAPLIIRGEEVERVSCLKFLGSYITEELTWSSNYSSLLKEAQQLLLTNLVKYSSMYRDTEIPLHHLELPTYSKIPWRTLGPVSAGPLTICLPCYPMEPPDSETVFIPEP
ncbi:olfactory receptor 11A1-like [Channa argus]|uniref:olfactory receptor 11A1-like n=1 Tax=Channa argus TaxID=215402 RepID=UPI0035220068